MPESSALNITRFGAAAAIGLTLLASRILASWGRHVAARDVAELALVPVLLLGLTWLLDLTRGGGPDGIA